MDNIVWNFLLVKVFDPICMEGSPWWTLGIGLSFHWKRNNWVNNVLPPALPPNYLKITNSDQSLPVFAKTLFVVSSRSTANKQEKINLCLKEIGSFILSINHPETFPLFVWNKYIGLPGRVGANKLARLRRDQKNCAVVTISWQSEIEIVFSLLFLLLEYFILL